MSTYLGGSHQRAESEIPLSRHREMDAFGCNRSSSFEQAPCIPPRRTQDCHRRPRSDSEYIHRAPRNLNTGIRYYRFRLPLFIVVLVILNHDERLLNFCGICGRSSLHCDGPLLPYEYVSQNLGPCASEVKPGWQQIRLLLALPAVPPSSGPQRGFRLS